MIFTICAVTAGTGRRKIQRGMGSKVTQGKKYNKYVPLICLAVYLLFIFYITLYSRSFSLIRTCRLELFWSFLQWAKGNAGTGKQILLNIALFVPAGYFLANVLHAWNRKRVGLLAAGLSLVISVAIEGIQYVDGLGLAEWDDVFNNVLGACLGIGVYKLLVRCCRKESLPWWKLGLSVLFLLAGVVGCRMVHMTPPLALSTLFQQFSFAVTRVDRNGNDLWLQGTCRAYFRDTPAYRIVLKSERTGQERQAVTERDGENFRAAVSASPDEKWEVLVQFKYYAPVKTATYIHKDRVEYVSGEVPGPDIRDTDLAMVVNYGVLKAWEPRYDVYVYQFNDRLYWLVGSPLDRKTEMVFRLYTDEPGRLPEPRKKYGFDNLGFRAGDKNEITRTMRSGKYRVFVSEIPAAYHITAVSVGFYADKKMQWSRQFRVE